MSDEELIARLRLYGSKFHHEFGHNDAAADRIEALTKERDDYAHKLMQANNTYTEMHLEIERLSDKLAKAVEAMEDIKRYSSCGDTRRKAIETLAEIKGESHE